MLLQHIPEDVPLLCFHDLGFIEPARSGKIELGEEKGYPELMAPYGLPGPGAEDVQVSQISDSYEEKGKEEKQLVIHRPKGLPVQENHGWHHHCHDEGQGNQTKDMKNTEEEKEKEKEGLLPWQFYFPGRQGRNDGFREKPS